MQIQVTVQFPSQKVCLFSKEERFISESELYGLCLYPGDIATPAELLCCLTGTCTNSVNRGRIAERAADFLLVPLHSSSQAPANECKLRFFLRFFFHAFHISWEIDTFCYVRATQCQFWSMI